MLEIGDKAPEFCIPNQDEVEICLRDLKGKWIILYFYPKDNTSGCTTEALDFTQAEIEFDNLDAVILGVSPDSPKKHRNFIEKQELTITLLSDGNKNLSNAYKVWQLKKTFGKEYMGIVRSTFIINPKGIISAIWKNVRVKEHSSIVQEELKKVQTIYKETI